MKIKRIKKTKNNKYSLKSRGIYLLPNLFTTSALFAGFYGIVAATKGLFTIAAIALFIAMVLDSLDGRVARLTNTQSDFGAQLDSLSDMVAFGLAPALIVYHWSLMGFGKLGWLISFFYTATAALRLARFNVQVDVDKKYFKGLPAPAAAAVLVSLVWNCEELGLTGNSHAIALVTLMVTGIVAVLMVSSFRYYSFKTINFIDKVSPLWAFIFVVVIMVIVLEPPKILFVGFGLYAISGLLTTFIERRKLK